MSFEFLQGKSILVTGGTGSFGQRCVRTLLDQTEASRVVIFSRDELKQSEMEANIPDPDQRLRFFLGDIRDESRLERAFRGVDFIIHAAALKHVPMLEYNPYEAVKTNIIGTQNVIEAAINQGIEKVLLISTDKAANPVSLYGATKLCSEKLIVNGNFYVGDGESKFSVVRYGNVFGSRGSLVEVIQQQRKTGTLKLTHPDMTRFWITLDYGIQFVLDMLGKMHGGEIFVPKIPSMKSIEIMEILAPECSVQIIGIRPGEKLHEVLITQEEARHTKEFDRYYAILPEGVWWPHHEKYTIGVTAPEDFSYSSHTNTDWLTEDDVKRFIVSL